MDNTSGLSPRGHAVLLAPYESTATQQGMIQLPDSVKERTLLVDQRAIVVEIGPCAWDDEPVPRAQVGDKVLVTKFAGYMSTGPADGKQYRLVNDRDIFACITDEGVKS